MQNINTPEPVQKIEPNNMKNLNVALSELFLSNTSQKHKCAQIHTLLRVWDCPTSISTLEASMDRQKFTKMMDLSERMYLRIKEKQENHTLTTATVLQL